MSGECSIIFDSGTSWISGPTSILGGVRDAGAPARNCFNLASMPKLSFDLCGREFELTPEEYTNKAHISALNVDVCQSGFEVHEDNATSDPRMKKAVIVGDSFLRKHFVHHDIRHKRVGLALAQTLAEERIVV